MKGSVLLSTLFPLLCLLPRADGHGYMYTPRSRNWYAHEEGTSAVTPKEGAPLQDFCYHCLNVNSGVCGMSLTQDFDNYVDVLENPMPWMSQEEYREGQKITVRSYLDTHHNGHMVIAACRLEDVALGSNSDCFDDPSKWLEFVRDDAYDMPKDPRHPERGYYFGGQGGSAKDFEMTFRLPMGVYGDEVMLQWKYITANSCTPPGYKKYFAGENSQNKPLPASFWTSGLTDCKPPYPNDGGRDPDYYPERFYNCAEVTILPVSPTRSPRPTEEPTTAAPVSPVLVPTEAPFAGGCCSQDFRECVTWCGTTEASCRTCGQDMGWIEGPRNNCEPKWGDCTADEWSCCPGLVCERRDQYYASCQVGEGKKPTPAPVAKPVRPPVPEPSSPMEPPSSAKPTRAGEGCCTRDFKNCNETLEGWCSESAENCMGTCNKWWLPRGPKEGCTERYGMCSSDADCCCPAKCDSTGQCNFTGPTSVLTCGKPTGPAPTRAPIAGPRPQPTLPPVQGPGPSPAFTCSPSADLKSSHAALLSMGAITREISQSPPILAIQSEGGAAGSGTTVSEGQAYGILTAALAMVSSEEGTPEYVAATETFEGMFRGWKKMCQLSSSPCQATKYCHGSPCLPGWKYSGDLSTEIGTGAAPDADEDAIAGMIIAVTVARDASNPPSWLAEVTDWADRSATSFLEYNTVLSVTGKHRLLKLGSCWGGWDNNGNNPSYHAPGQYRLMRDFQKTVKERDYALPDLGGSLGKNWNMLIDTSYKFLETTQCPDTGLVPNWALVTEESNKKLDKYPGAFSGSGTPQYEFGAEASRTLWRVTFDAVVYPEEGGKKAGDFLSPLHSMMVQHFDPSPNNAWEYFKAGMLQDCANNPGHVNAVFGSWQWNYFISAPVYSTLASTLSESLFALKSFDQQDMVDAACGRLQDTANQSYYALSWAVLGTMTLNGDLAQLGDLLGTRAPTTQAPAGTPTANPIKVPTEAPASSPVKTPTKAPVGGPVKVPTKAPVGGPGCCSQNFKECVSWCGTSRDECLSCGQDVFWIKGPQTGCVARFGDCTNDVNGCCGTRLECVGDQYYRQCKVSKQTKNPTMKPTVNPSENPSAAPSEGSTVGEILYTGQMTLKDYDGLKLSKEEEDQWIQGTTQHLSTELANKNKQIGANYQSVDIAITNQKIKKKDLLITATYQLYYEGEPDLDELKKTMLKSIRSNKLSKKYIKILNNTSSIFSGVSKTKLKL